jgi:hypothetical protein
MSDPQFVCISARTAVTTGGVHQNSGARTTLYALMVDGGTYNALTITGPARPRLQNRIQSAHGHLTAGSVFSKMLRPHSLRAPTWWEAGITVSDCTQVNNAIAAVEMTNRWNCTDATQPAPLCPVGSGGFRSGVLRRF